MHSEAIEAHGHSKRWTMTSRGAGVGVGLGLGLLVGPDDNDEDAGDEQQHRRCHEVGTDGSRCEVHGTSS